MAYKIFISYSTADLALVDKIRAELSAQCGTEVSLYVAEYSAPAGVRLDDDIKRNLATCDLFCVLWGRNAKDSGWVAQEIGIAEGKGRTIVPIVLDRDLPPPGFIQDRKYIPAYEGIESAIHKLREIVAANVNEKNWALQEQKKKTDGVVLVGLGVLVLMVLASKE